MTKNESEPWIHTASRLAEVFEQLTQQIASNALKQGAETQMRDVSPHIEMLADDLEQHPADQQAHKRGPQQRLCDVLIAQRT